MSIEPYKGRAEVLSLEGQALTSASVSLEVDAQGECRMTAFLARKPGALGTGGEFLLRIEGWEDIKIRVSSAEPGFFARGSWRAEVLANTSASG